MLTRFRFRRLAASFAVLLWLAVALLSALGCVSQVQPWYEVDPGEGRLLFIRYHAEKTGPRTALEVHTHAGTTVLPVDEPRLARWLDPNSLLVLAGGSAANPDAPGQKLIHVDLVTGATTVVRDATGRLEIEPSADGRTLAWVRSVGDVAARVLDVDAVELLQAPLGTAYEGFEAPRWGPAPGSLVARGAMTVLDDVATLDEGGMPIQTSEPRLVLLSTESHAVEPLEPFVAAHPLWWDRAGIWARQDRGLVRCQPAGGCDLVYSPAEGQRVVDGRPVGRDEALLIVAMVGDGSVERLPHAVHRVNLATGEGDIADLLEAGEYFVDIDWIALPDPAR